MSIMFHSSPGPHPGSQVPDPPDPDPIQFPDPDPDPDPNPEPPDDPVGADGAGVVPGKKHLPIKF